MSNQTTHPVALAETAQNLLELTVQTLAGNQPSEDDGYGGSGDDPFVEATNLIYKTKVPLALQLPESGEIYPLVPEDLLILTGAQRYLVFRLSPEPHDHRILQFHSVTQRPNFEVIALGKLAT